MESTGELTRSLDHTLERAQSEGMVHRLGTMCSRARWVRALVGLALAVACARQAGDTPIAQTGEPESPRTDQPAIAQIGDPASLSTGEVSTSPTADPGNGQTGSIAPSECSVDADCVPDLERWRNPRYEVELLSARCGVGDHWTRGGSFGGLPTCICSVRETKWEPERRNGPAQPYDVEFDLELTSPAAVAPLTFPECLAYERPGTCAYCAYEFPGCFMDEPTEHCESVCEEVLGHRRRIEQAPHAASLRLAQCSPAGRCNTVIELDGQCYNMASLPDVPFACNVPDEELGYSQNERYRSPTYAARLCTEPPQVPCRTAGDCPGGLACNGQVCGFCEAERHCIRYADDAGVDDEPSTRPDCAEVLGGYACGGDEVCVSGTCVRRDQAECIDASEDCDLGSFPSPVVSCELSGIDHTRIRGNAATWSRCPTCAHPAPTTNADCFFPVDQG
jgi:hypothetical protein